MTTNTLIRAFGALCLVGAAGCAHATPKELADARDAVERAEAGPARKENPAQLHTAQKLLEGAEAAFEEDGNTAHTRDLAYVAMRSAQRAEVQARTAQNQRQLAKLEEKASRQRAQELARLRDERQQQQQSLTAEQQARADAERRADEAAARLARIATVKQDQRGMVIGLSGTTLFESGKSELSLGAESRLREVAEVLATQSPDAQIVVEGHTDSRGKDSMNLELSVKRAEAVADFLAAHGVARDRVRAEGLGFSRPIANNRTAEGRATNRRVEIVVQPAARR